MGDSSTSSETKSMTTWRDLVITPAVEVLILGPSIAVAWVLHLVYPAGFFVSLVVFYVASVLISLLVLKVLRTFLLVREGVYSYDDNVEEIYLFNLYEVILLMNLGIPYTTSIVPPLMRKEFYQLLGCRMGKGMMVIGGRMEGPHYVTVGSNAVIADGAMLYPHIVSNADTSGNRFLVIGHIEVAPNAIIGSRCTIMPSVRIGKNAMVAAMSYVPMNTEIPAGEIWSGVPAQKVGEVAKSRSDSYI